MSLHQSSGHTPPADRRKLWEDFRNDQQTHAILRITPDEVERLHTVFMLSRFTEKSQLIDALNRMRYGLRH